MFLIKKSTGFDKDIKFEENVDFDKTQIWRNSQIWWNSQIWRKSQIWQKMSNFTKMSTFPPRVRVSKLPACYSWPTSFLIHSPWSLTFPPEPQAYVFVKLEEQVVCNIWGTEAISFEVRQVLQMFGAQVWRDNPRAQVWRATQEPKCDGITRDRGV